MYYLVTANWYESGTPKTGIGMVWADKDMDAFKKASTLYQSYPLTSLKLRPMWQSEFDAIKNQAIYGGMTLLLFTGIEEE